MASEVSHNFPGFFKVYKDGRIERYWNTDTCPAGLDIETGIESKDVVVSPETSVKVRIFLPKIEGPAKKLPLIVHYHGGGFCIGSPFATSFKNFLSILAAKTNAIAMSIDYRLAPEHPLPTAHDDSWAALEWVAKHADGKGPEPWLNDYADLGQVILAGESAGANLAHYVAVQAGVTGLSGVKITRLVLVHPYFGAKASDPLIAYMFPTSSATDEDPKLHPRADENVLKMKCEKILVSVAEKDPLKGRGESYFETMSKCGWGGTVEFFETKDEDHCFHFFKPKSENVGPLMARLADFIKQ